jgi:hypothetical protein
MRDFTKVSPAVWKSQKFAGLPDSNCRLFYLYCLTSAHQTNAGISKIPIPYAAHDLQQSLEVVEKSLEACIEAGLLEHDPDTDEIMVANWFTFNIPMNIRHRLGVAKTIERVESVKLQSLANDALKDVYFDPDANAPNRKPPPEKVDAVTGEILTFENSAKPPVKRPDQMSRNEMEKIFSQKRRARGQ